MRRIIILRSIIVLMPLLFMNTCTKDVYAPDACFQENILPIFVSNCTMSGCHNPTDKAEGYDLSTYEGIRKGIVAKHPLQSEVYKVVAGKNPSMPQSPYAKLKEADVALIKVWINTGAKNSSNCHACDTMDFTYAGRVKPLMETWCVGCHSGSGANGGVNLSNYDGVANAVSGNKFMGSLNHESGFFAMPPSGSKLSACEIDAIQKWIDNGHENN